MVVWVTLYGLSWEKNMSMSDSKYKTKSIQLCCNGQQTYFTQATKWNEECAVPGCSSWTNPYQDFDRSLRKQVLPQALRFAIPVSFYAPKLRAMASARWIIVASTSRREPPGLRFSSIKWPICHEGPLNKTKVWVKDMAWPSRRKEWSQEQSASN